MIIIAIDVNDEEIYVFAPVVWSASSLLENPSSTSTLYINGNNETVTNLII